jgi:hypothetical protein
MAPVKTKTEASASVRGDFILRILIVSFGGTDVRQLSGGSAPAPAEHDQQTRKRQGAVSG